MLASGKLFIVFLNEIRSTGIMGFQPLQDLLPRELRDLKAYACSTTDLGEVLFYDVLFWD